MESTWTAVRCKLQDIDFPTIAVTRVTVRPLLVWFSIHSAGCPNREIREKMFEFRDFGELCGYISSSLN